MTGVSDKISGNGRIYDIKNANRFSFFQYPSGPPNQNGALNTNQVVSKSGISVLIIYQKRKNMNAIGMLKIHAQKTL